MPDTEPSILSSPAAQRLPEPRVGAVQAESQAKLRCLGAIVGLICLAMLAAAWHLEARWLPFGPGTQISLPGCVLQESTGYPCPTCGMTRAWARAVRGNLLGAFRANLAGAILAAGCMLGLFGGVGTAVGGRGFYRRLVCPVTGMLWPIQWLYVGVGLIVLGWAWNGLWAFLAQQQG